MLLLYIADAIISYLVTSRSSSLGAADDARSNDATYNFFLSERLDYFISVNDWVGAVSMQDQAFEMAAKALEDWLEGARRIYRSLVKVYEAKEETQRTLDFFTSQGPQKQTPTTRLVSERFVGA